MHPKTKIKVNSKIQFFTLTYDLRIAANHIIS